MEKYFNKKGELTTKQLVTLIILIASFAIILFLIFRLDLGQVTREQVCHNSVVLQARNPLDKLDTSVEFDCEARDVCITGGEECVGSFDKIIDVDKSDNSGVIKGILGEMTNCWWMFGEGKLDFSFVAFGEKTRCGICSRISFDSSLNDVAVGYGELFYYMNEDFQNSQTYKKYLFPKGINYVKNGGFDDLNKKYSKRSISLDENYVVVFGWNPKALGDNDLYLPVNILKNSELKDYGCEAFDLIRA